MAETGKARHRMRNGGTAGHTANPQNETALATLAVMRQEYGVAPGKTELVRYIGEMSAELASLAGNARLDILAYFLNMAQVEAEAIARKATYEDHGLR